MNSDRKKPKLLAKIHLWVHNHHTAAYAIAAAGVLIASLLVGFFIMYKKPQKSDPTPSPAVVKKADPPQKFYSPLSGKEVADLAATTQPVTAIMIENSPDARPQSGIKDASIVFEAIAEGGITRFLTLFQQDKPGLIGPVRSLRLYYVDWLAPFNASVAHVGGSKFALDEIRNGNYRDIDQFFNAATYWRANDRYAPHNVYTNFQKLDTLNQAKGYNTSNFTGFSRKDPQPSAEPTANTINVTISGPLYNSSYVYNKASNTYARSQAGAPHLDREAGQITPTSVVVLKTTMQKVMEDGYREQIVTTGSGQGVIFQDGVATEVSWHKKDRASQLTFTDSAGKDVPLNRGQTWVTAVPVNAGGAVSWK